METISKQFRKRNAILACLQHTHAHPSAETIHAQLRQDYPDISLATVYRNLALFKSQGIIASLGIVDGVERFDANTAQHVHFICTHCQSVIDLPELNPPEALCSAAADSVGGQVDTCQLHFTGLCSSCLHSSPGKEEPV